MIVFELICQKHHRFEGWFSSADDFEGQKGRGLLTCPSCGHSSIEKLPTAKIRKAELLPAVCDDRSHAVVPAAKPSLNDLIEFVLMNTDNVGKEFAVEARKIYAKEVPYRGIRGSATVEETEQLLEEGIPVMALPVPPQSDWH